jgi:hypothetical protein
VWHYSYGKLTGFGQTLAKYGQSWPLFIFIIFIFAQKYHDLIYTNVWYGCINDMQWGVEYVWGYEVMMKMGYVTMLQLCSEQKSDN